MNIEAESTNYKIIFEYEYAILIHKKTEKNIIIGDFYGDPCVAIISKDETFCVVGGCGVIVYFLRYPFKNYEYEQKTTQWDEYFRGGDVWVESIEEMENYIKITFENYNEPKLLDIQNHKFL